MEVGRPIYLRSDRWNMGDRPDARLISENLLWLCWEEAGSYWLFASIWSGFLVLGIIQTGLRLKYKWLTPLPDGQGWAEGWGPAKSRKYHIESVEMEDVQMAALSWFESSNESNFDDSSIDTEESFNATSTCAVSQELFCSQCDLRPVTGDL